MNNILMYSNGTNPHANLALETALMDAIRPGDMCLYLWQNRHTVVIGRNQNAWKECRCELLQAENGTLARRSSGGGAVYHDLGNLNFTFAASPERYDLEAQLAMIIRALARTGIAAEFTGRNDITVSGRKFSGNAFKHTKGCSMQHGTLLISADMEKLSRYLRPSESKLKAKGVSSVRSRVCNLTEFAPTLTIDDAKQLLADAFRAQYGGAELLDPSELDTSAIYPLYSSWEWNYGETPRFDVSLEKRFPWGGLEIMLTLKHASVERAAVYSDSLDTELPGKISAALEGAAYTPALCERLAFIPEVAAWLKDELPM
jgi:lipoate-protein ligase A